MSQTDRKRVLRSRSPRSRSVSPRISRDPDTAKGKKVKSKNQLLKQQKLKEFDAYIDDLTKKHKQYQKLCERKIKTSHHLVLKKDDELHYLVQDEITAMGDEYRKLLQHGKKLHRDGIKNRREKIVPTDFKSHYTPIRVGQVFVDFFNTLTLNGKKMSPNFGATPDPKTGTWMPNSNLLDSLPRVRQGLLLKNSLTLLMNIYPKVNDLKSKTPKEGQKNIPDARMNKVFGDQPALYFENRTLMKHSGQSLSTYDMLSRKHSAFDRSKIQNYFFQSILSLNTYKPVDLESKDITDLSDEGVREELIEEFMIIKLANDLLNA
jgi:hypothetical protein